MKKLIHKINLVEEKDKIIFFLIITTMINIITTIFKLISGIYLTSIWFLINSLFYFVIFLSRSNSIKNYQQIHRQSSKEEKKKIEIKNYFANGIILILLGITYFGVSYYMLKHSWQSNINGWIVYLVATSSFASLYISIYGKIKYRKNKNYIIKAVKNTNFCCSLTSIVLTQVVLLENFADARVNYYNGFAGILVSIIILSIGISMLITSQKMRDGEKQW